MTLAQFARLVFGRGVQSEITILMNEGYEYPVPTSVVVAAAKRTYIHQAMKLAIEDRHYVTAFLLGRYLHRIQPVLISRENE